MKLKFISIYNFRAIQELKQLEVSNLSTFVGKNDSGKSSILKAIDCFFNENKFDQKDIFKAKKNEEDTIIELSFDPLMPIDDLALDEMGLITIKKKFSYTKNKPKFEPFYLVKDFVKSEYQDLWNKKEQELNQLIKNLGGEEGKSGRGKKNVFRIEQIKELLAKLERKNAYHSLNDFVSNLKKEYELTLPEYSLFEAEQDLDVGTTSFQSQFKTLISECFERNKEKTDLLEDEIKKGLLIEFEEIRKLMVKNITGLKKLTPTLNCDWKKSVKFDLELNFEGENYDVPISHKGTGFKRLLMVAYFEYLAKKKNVRNQIFAIDDPETYLHPSAQEDLLQSIIEISENSQFFLTTHSPVFAGATNGDNSILVTKTLDGISKYSRGEDIINQIINELGIKPDYNLLRDSKFLIFVEGKDDFGFVNIIAKTLLSKMLEDDGILCVIGGGSSLKNYADLDLFKKLSGGNRYAVLVDRNGSLEEKTKNKIKQRCDKDGALFLKLSKRTIENYCIPERIIDCYIQEIKDREGAESQNPRISEIELLSIQIDKDTDVAKYLESFGLNNFKSGFNMKVFDSMSKADWKKADSEGELKTFLQDIYDNIKK